MYTIFIDRELNIVEMSILPLKHPKMEPTHTLSSGLKTVVLGNLLIMYCFLI